MRLLFLRGKQKSMLSPSAFPRATMHLRWVLRVPRNVNATGIYFDGMEKVLQQAWFTDPDTIEWRDVETVVEG